MKYLSTCAIILLIIVILFSTTTNKCIVIIDGINFDVTIYKNLHSGGDIFNCGTDMTQIFWARHTQMYLDFMQRYKIL